MSFIPKNPLSVPKITSNPSTLTGTRGLFAKEDGWYEVDDNGTINKLTTDDKINSLKYYGKVDVVPSDKSLFIYTLNDTDMTATISTANQLDIEEITIPYECEDGGKIYKVTSIEDPAFMGNSSVKKVIIPSCVTNIGDYAFCECFSLESIEILDGLVSIGKNAFDNCSSLTSISIPDSVTSIGDNAFYGCSSLTSISIPDSVTKIGIMVFGRCSSLTSVEIPDNVTSIGEGAFYDLYNLDLIYFKGTKKQWDTITIESGNEALENAIIHYEWVPTTKGYVDEKFSNTNLDIQTDVVKLWMPNTEFKENDIVVGFHRIEPDVLVSVVYTCLTDHTSSSGISVIEDEVDYLDKWRAITNVCSYTAYMDGKENIIHDTYATKSEIQVAILDSWEGSY